MNGKFYRYVVFAMLALAPCVSLANGQADPPVMRVQERTITGRIMDAEEAGIIGVSIKVQGTNIGTVSDLNGNFSLTVPSDNAILEITSVGWVSQEIPIKGRSEIRVTLVQATEGVEEVVITAFGAAQKKESVVSAISTVNPGELRVPSSNLTTAFAGRMSGVIAYQRSGEPGLDNAEFFIRGITTFSAGGKRDPLILVDGIEMTTNDLARLNVDDIESFSILKDASAAALYGARGANGVILVTTKVGTADRLTINLRAEQSTSMNTKLVDLADPVTYMRLHNQSVRTRDAERELPHTLSAIFETERGSDPVRYPNVDWYDYLLKDHATNRRINLNLTGGGQAVQYYLAAGYQNDQGILKESSENLFNNNINIDRLQIRSNVTIRFAPTTTGVVRAYGSFDDRTGPAAGGADVFHWARNATPVKFLPYYPGDDTYSGVKHILFGMGPELGQYVNPLARVVSSNQESKESTMLLQLEMEHKFIGALEGLTARGTFNAMRKAFYSLERSYSPFYYTPMTTLDGSYQLLALNPDTGTEYLRYGNDSRSVNAALYGDVRLTYNKLLNGVHDLNALFVGTIRNETGALNFATVYNNGPSDFIQASLPLRNISSAARLAYGFDSRYFVEFNLGVNGTERFAKKNRWGFFPTIGAAWAIHNEHFMANTRDVVSNLRLKGTYGKVGNDAIGHVNDRFFYMSQIDMSGPGYWFGLPGAGNDNYFRSGIRIDRYANDQITWEIATKSNVGLEIGLFDNRVTLNSDYFWETRENILQTRPDIPTTMGLRTIPQANLGVAEGKGFESELKYDQTFNENFWLLVNGNFTYASAKYTHFEEADYSDVPWRSAIGRKLNQPMGYIAERLFIDEEEVNNSPRQFSGGYMAGDIKYKDINGDGVINQDDMVPIGYPTVPEIIYGGGFTVGYKAFDLNVFFQGSARSSFFINPSDITPFVNQGQRGILQYIADDHWSETNRDIYAFWPRLSDYDITNNSQTSTYWIQNGAFLRLKQAEVGFTVPQSFTNRLHINSLRLYASGTNLLHWSSFKMWDPEMAGNGLKYPLQRVFNFGISVGL